MNIIIVGCGKIGYTIAKDLSAEKGAEVTVIENKTDAIERALETIDVMLIKGDGLSAATLIEAGAQNADLIVCVTNADESNILCGILAKSLGTKRTIARVRNIGYAAELNEFWKGLGIDMVINPELETAREISRLLRFPSVDDISTFVRGRVELVSFKVSDDDFCAGKSVASSFNSRNMGVLLSTVERDNSVVIPNGDFVLEAGDVVRVLGRPANIADLFNFMGRSTERVKSAAIIGGSKITYYLANQLTRLSGGIDLKIVELDKERCVELGESLPHCLIINGDGADEELFLAEDLDRTEAIVCLTDRDEVNSIIALYAIQVGVRKVIIKINHINPNMIKNLGIGSIVSPKNIISDQIIHYVRGLVSAAANNLRTLSTIFDNDEDKVEAVEFLADNTARCLQMPLKHLPLKPGVLIGCIVRDADIIIPSGDDYIADGDSVIVIIKNGNPLELNDILRDDWS